MNPRLLVDRSWIVAALALVLWMGSAVSIDRGVRPAAAQEQITPAEDVAEPATPGDTAAAATTEEAGKREKVFWSGGGKLSGLVELYIKGGVFMHPLLLCSVLGLAVIIERLITLRKASIDTRKFMDELITALREKGLHSALEVCRKTRGPIAAILHSGLTRAERGSEAVEKAIMTTGTIEMSFLQRGFGLLASVVSIAPMLGFLGTVSGMIHAFEAIAAAEQVSAKLVANGIAEALITTAAGLMIAIPVQAMNNSFIAKVDRMILEMEEAATELIETLSDIEAGRNA